MSKQLIPKQKHTMLKVQKRKMDILNNFKIRFMKKRKKKEKNSRKQISIQKKKMRQINK